MLYTEHANEEIWLSNNTTDNEVKLVGLFSFVLLQLCVRNVFSDRDIWRKDYWIVF